MQPPAPVPPLSPPRGLLLVALLVLCIAAGAQDALDPPAQDATAAEEDPLALAQDSCNGVFLTYTFIERTKEFPRVKNASAQAYAFKAQATVLNTMTEDLKAWKMFVEFQHDEILVSASGAVLTDSTDFPARVGNGTTLAGFPQADLLNAIDTAGDMTQIQVQIDIVGTQFGVKPPGVPMPKTIKLANDGFKCPAPTRKAGQMYVCCAKDPKFKTKKDNSTRFLPRQKGDLTIAYDILQAYGSSYQAQVTIDNWSPLGRLDNWNLTWEWKRGEFISKMRGAYTLKKDASQCIYSAAAAYYRDFDFSTAMSCDKKPIIVDLPPDREKDNEIGNLPFCCKNGTLLPPTMDQSKSRAIFQLQVFKLPPDLNRTALFPPQNWKINGYLNPQYVCGPPIRVSPMEFPDPSGLMSETTAVASWQVACNITRPKRRSARCCVSFSTYYNDSIVPCNTCACGCSDAVACDPDARPLLLPSEALLIPFENRTAKAKAWAKIKHLNVPNPMPLFNWQDYTFKDWFAAIELGGDAFKGYENVYSFNGTKLDDVNRTIFFQGLEGLQYLVPETDGKDPKTDLRVPGKQQSVISFTKKNAPGINIMRGDGFPKRVFFDGEECALPDDIPIGSGQRRSASHGLFQLVLPMQI